MKKSVLYLILYTPALFNPEKETNMTHLATTDARFEHVLNTLEKCVHSVSKPQAAELSAVMDEIVDLKIDLLDGQ